MGTNSNPLLNNPCGPNIDRDGLYVCPTPLTGDYVGAYRDSDSLDYYNVSEIRAYSWLPIDASTVLVTTNTMPNLTLIDSTRINIATSGNTILNDAHTILNDDVFTSSSETTNSYWLMNLSTRKHVKVVLAFGQKSISGDWVLRVGDDPNPLNNPILYTLPAGVWAREIKLG